MTVRMFGSRCVRQTLENNLYEHVYTCTHTDIFEDVTGFLYNTNVHVSSTHGNRINGFMVHVNQPEKIRAYMYMVLHVHV